MYSYQRIPLEESKGINLIGLLLFTETDDIKEGTKFFLEHKDFNDAIQCVVVSSNDSLMNSFNINLFVGNKVIGTVIIQSTGLIENSKEFFSIIKVIN